LTQSNNTGWNSDVRKEYAKKISDKHTKRVGLIKSGNSIKAREMAVEDFFYPLEIKFEVYE
jgi:hypothetical protein